MKNKILQNKEIYIDTYFPLIDSKNMRDKLKNEEEERARKEKEMADKLKEAASASENEILTLHKRMAAENAKRIDEINDLR